MTEWYIAHHDVTPPLRCLAARPHGGFRRRLAVWASREVLAPNLASATASKLVAGHRGSFSRLPGPTRTWRLPASAIFGSYTCPRHRPNLNCGIRFLAKLDRFLRDVDRS
jgi:hypothetical protein